MNSLANNLIQAFRKSRAPISTGAILLLALWLLSADFLDSEVAPSAFGIQFTALVAKVPGIAFASLLFIACAVVGTISIRLFHQVIELRIQALYERYRLRSRGHINFDDMRSAALSQRQASSQKRALKPFTKAWGRTVWAAKLTILFAHHDNWRPIEDAREPQKRDPWMRELTSWASTKLTENDESERFLDRQLYESLRSRLNRNPEVWHRVVSLRKKMRNDPSAPFSTDRCADISERLRSSSNEDDYRIGILPAVILLLSACAARWSWWILLMEPVLIWVYIRTVFKRYMLADKALSWLIDAEVNEQLRSNELNQIHLLARIDATTELREYEAARRR